MSMYPNMTMAEFSFPKPTYAGKHLVVDGFPVEGVNYRRLRGGGDTRTELYVAPKVTYRGVTVPAKNSISMGGFLFLLDKRLQELTELARSTFAKSERQKTLSMLETARRTTLRAWEAVYDAHVDAVDPDLKDELLDLHVKLSGVEAALIRLQRSANTGEETRPEEAAWSSISPSQNSSPK